MAQRLFLLVGISITPVLMVQQNAATLDHIQSSSVLNVGYRQLPPFSFTDHDNRVTGYTTTICNTIADKLRQYLRLNNLTVHYTPVNSAECFSALNSREIGTDCGVNTNTPERTASVSFSENYYTAKTRIISLRENSIRPIFDLRGCTVSLTGSSKDLLEFNKANREQRLNISAITSTTIKDALEKMTHNKFVVFFIDDILAWPLISHNERPELFSVSPESIGNDIHYAIMMKKNDQQFVTFVSSMLKDFLALPVNMQSCKKWLSPWSCRKLKDPSPGSRQHSH